MNINLKWELHDTEHHHCMVAVRCEIIKTMERKMSQFDQINGTLKKLYDAAQAQLKEIELKRKEALDTIAKLEPLFGKKTYSLETLKATSSVSHRKAAAAPKKAKAAKTAKAAAGKKPRIKEEEIRTKVINMLEACAPTSMSPIEIFGNLIKSGMPDTASFRTRVYGKLGAWAKAGLIRKVGRGVYQSVKAAK